MKPGVRSRLNSCLVRIGELRDSGASKDVMIRAYHDLEVVAKEALE